MMKLNINKMLIRNFKSFGDYDTTIDLNKRGPSLIVGEVDGDPTKSNGAGKSTIPEAIIWCLFGRLSDLHDSGDKIINWDSGKDCMIRLWADNGYEIIRTRKCSGHSDLLILKDGEPIDGGDSTNTDAQKTLNSIFGTNFSTFLSSLYFGQSSGSYLGLSPQKQKEVIEKIFGLSKLKYYADVTKSKMDGIEQTQNEVRKSIESLQQAMSECESQLISLNSKSKALESAKDLTIKSLRSELSSLQTKTIKVIDTKAIEKQWSVIGQVEEGIRELSVKRDVIDVEISALNKRKISAQAALIRLKPQRGAIQISANSRGAEVEKWMKMEGTTCPTCEQRVQPGQVKKKVQELTEAAKSDIADSQQKLMVIDSEITKCESEIKLVDTKIKDLESARDKLKIKISESTISFTKIKAGKMTLTEAKQHNDLVAANDKLISDCQKRIDNESTRENPFTIMIAVAHESAEKKQAEKAGHEKKLEALNKILSHLMFIYRAYSDKRQLRAHIISGHLGLLNSRLAYYYNELGIGTDMKFNESLQFKSDRWPYELHSGGERKRFELAIMCALNDTMTSMHGLQCNIQVLDEIDKDLDKDGVEEYVRLIIDDLSNRIETLLVISHKDDITYAFPSQIKVTKDGDLSRICDN